MTTKNLVGGELTVVNGLTMWWGNFHGEASEEGGEPPPLLREVDNDDIRDLPRWWGPGCDCAGRTPRSHPFEGEYEHNDFTNWRIERWNSIKRAPNPPWGEEFLRVEEIIVEETIIRMEKDGFFDK